MKPPKRNKIAQDLRTPKYRKRVVPDKKKKSDKEKCRKTLDFKKSNEYASKKGEDNHD